MSTVHVRFNLAVAIAVTAALLGLPGLVQAHPELRGKWKEINGEWELTFEEGKRNGDTYEGEWKGSVHPNNTFHERGRYHLKMETATRGKLTLYHNNKEIVEAKVHFEDGGHKLEFGKAEYRRERK